MLFQRSENLKNTCNSLKRVGLENKMVYCIKTRKICCLQNGYWGCSAIFSLSFPFVTVYNLSFFLPRLGVCPSSNTFTIVANPSLHVHSSLFTSFHGPYIPSMSWFLSCGQLLVLKISIFGHCKFLQWKGYGKD